MVLNLIEVDAMIDTMMIRKPNAATSFDKNESGFTNNIIIPTINGTTTSPVFKLINPRRKLPLKKDDVTVTFCINRYRPITNIAKPMTNSASSLRSFFIKNPPRVHIKYLEVVIECKYLVIKPLYLVVNLFTRKTYLDDEIKLSYTVIEILFFIKII